jgi:hypothetical protein
MGSVALWFEKGALTRTARDIFERSQKFLATIEPLDVRTLDQRFEDHFLRTELDGMPLDISLLREFATQYARELRPLLRGEQVPEPFDVLAMTDDEVLDLIHSHPRWLEWPDVAARVAQRRSELQFSRDGGVRKNAVLFIKRLANVSTESHRPVRHDPRVRAELVKATKARAKEIQQAWFALRVEYPDASLLEIGERLHEVLEGTPRRPLLIDRVKSYLAGLCAVVLDKDGKRHVSIEDAGWPHAVALAIVSMELQLSKSSLRSAGRSKS